MNTNKASQNASDSLRFKKAFWLRLPPHLSYYLGEKIMHLKSLMLSLKKSQNKPQHLWTPLKWEGIYFRNPLGIAAGLDKSAKFLPFWEHLGAGFIEVGTLTLLPQEPNPKPRLNQCFKELSLWNSMGFPNDGVRKIKKNLKAWEKNKNHSSSFPILANIGPNRNSKQVDVELAQLIHTLSPFVKAFVINLSSPNTPGLIDFLKPKNLNQLLKSLNKKLSNLLKNSPPPPLLLKWSPDLSKEDFKRSLDIATINKIKGHVLSNSSQLLGRNQINQYPKHGGVSGLLLAEKSKEWLKLTLEHLGEEEQKNQLIISVGGILDINEVKERLLLGAKLVETYSGFVFQGKKMFKNS